MSAVVLKPGVFKHMNCRNGIYPQSNIRRFAVPDEYVFWSVPYVEYAGVPHYTMARISEQPWADPAVFGKQFQPKFNQLDGNVNRVSFNGAYEIDENGYPLNPIGRTGLCGRGLLGRWGPNHAADSMVTRWKRDRDGNCIKSPLTQRNIVQMITIKRRDNKMWAIPGGMVDPGEIVSNTLKREFMEEAVCNIENKQLIEQFFAEGTDIYKGYVDDARNTDNAWIETIAVNFHDDCGDVSDQLVLSAGDDAAESKWTDLHKSLELHANHIQFVEQIVKHLNAHW